MRRPSPALLLALLLPATAAATPLSDAVADNVPDVLVPLPCGSVDVRTVHGPPSPPAPPRRWKEATVAVDGDACVALVADACGTVDVACCALLPGDPCGLGCLDLAGGENPCLRLVRSICEDVGLGCCVSVLGVEPCDLETFLDRYKAGLTLPVTNDSFCVIVDDGAPVADAVTVEERECVEDPKGGR